MGQHTFRKSAGLALVIVATLLSHGSGSDLNVCPDLRSELIGFFAAVYGTYTLRTKFLLQNMGSDGEECLRIKDGITEELFPCDSNDPTQQMLISSMFFSGWFFTLPGTSETLTIQGNYENALVKQSMMMGLYNQQWNFNYVSDTLFKIINTQSKKCLTGYPDKMTITNCSYIANIDDMPKNQLWKKKPVGARIIGQLKNKLWDKCVHGDNQTSGSDFAKVNLQECSSDDPGQNIEVQWTFVCSFMMMGSKATEFGSFYVLKGAMDNTNEQTISFPNGKLLSVVGPFVSKTQVEQMTAFVYRNQMWYAGASVSGWVRLRNYMTLLGNPDYCLAAAVNGSTLEIQNCGDPYSAATANQFWTFTQNS